MYKHWVVRASDKIESMTMNLHLHHAGIQPSAFGQYSTKTETQDMTATMCQLAADYLEKNLCSAAHSTVSWPHRFCDNHLTVMLFN